MSLLQTLQQRQAIRAYDGRPIEKEKIEQLLDAAILAPNDRLREPWHFYVIQGAAKERFNQVAQDFLLERFPTKPHLVEESMKNVLATPLIIVATSQIIEGDEASSLDNDYAVSCAIHSMWLMASELGLGFVWRTRGVGLARDERLKAFLSLSDQEKVIGSLFIGYPTDEATPRTARKPITQKTTWVE
ncbi:nitroreductase [Brevibacillus laterosporus]|uniref:nitroreductase family protein n=1 Tax=Brevibacillus laterosporus TaxID=1465 RepID=UPI0035A577AF